MSFKSPAHQVHNYVTKLIKGGLLRREPIWYKGTRLAPPSPTYLRERDRSGASLNPQFAFEKASSASAESSATPSSSSGRKELTRSSRNQKHLRWKSEKPMRIVYPEDKLRRQFYQDHPWELRRPRCLIEGSGDGTRRDWSSLVQEGRSLSDLTGEDVVQYQLYLMSTGKAEREAYSIATSEFYLLRAQEESEARAAKAEALAYGLKIRRSFVKTGLQREQAAIQSSA